MAGLKQGYKSGFVEGNSSYGRPEDPFEKTPQ